MIAARDLLRRAWGHPVAGGPLRVAVAYVLLVEGLIQLTLGRIDIPGLEVAWLEPGFKDAPIPRGVLVDGMVLGSVYACVAIGLVLVYRANRIINFAQAQLGAVPGVVALLLMARKGLPYPAAVLVAVLGGALLGGVVDVTVVRRFQRASRLVLTVATIGIGFLLLVAEFFAKKAVTGRIELLTDFPTPAADWHFSIGIVRFSGDHVVTVAVVGLLVTGLALFLRRTDLGVAVRAAAENGPRAALAGVPVGAVSTAVWVLAGALSAIGVFLRGPMFGLPLNGFVGPSLLLFGLTVAVIARMESLPTAFVAGLFVGVVDRAALFSTRRSALTNGVMLLVVLAALLVQRRQQRRVDEAETSTWGRDLETRPLPAAVRAMPRVRVTLLALRAAALLAVVVAPLVVGEAGTDVATRTVLFAMVAASVVVLTGWAGQISLGQFAVAGVGAGVAGGLAANHGTDFFVTLLLAGLAGAVVSVVVGLPAARIPGLFFAVATLAFAFAVESIVLNREFASWLLPRDLAFVERPVLYGRIDLANPGELLGLTVSRETKFYWVCLVILGLLLAALAALRRNRSGRVLVGVRDNSRMLQSYAVDPVRTRLMAFAVAGFVAAVAGALLAYEQGSVDAEAFLPELSIQLFVVAVIGGVTSLAGAVLGAIFCVVLPALPWVRDIQQIEIITSGVGLLVVLYALPGGLAGALSRVRDAGLRKVAGVTRADEGAPDTPVPDEAAPAVHVEIPDALLQVRRVEVSYGQLQVLFGVDLDVAEGEIVALLGTNGAGKSTLLAAISGLVMPNAGHVTFDGEDITRLDPAATARLGIAQMPGGRSVFPTLSVEENLRVGGWLLRKDGAAQRAAVGEALELFPRLAERRGTAAGDLSGGEQQMLGLAMAFLVRPRLLVIDELSLGLAPTIVAQLLAVVRRIRETGTAVLLVEQSLTVALDVADRAYFLERGEVRFAGAAADLAGRSDLLRSIFLRAAPAVVTEHAPELPPPTFDVPALEAQGLVRRYGGIVAVDDVSLAVRHGEVLGIIGPNGAGKTTIFDLLSGFQQPDRGSVLVAGEDVTALPAHARAARGLGRSFQDARLVPALSVAENIALGLERHIPVRDHLAALLNLPGIVESEQDVAWTVADLVELVGLGPHRDKLVRELSTGTRRIVDLAMGLAHSPSVLLLDEPSSGIAQRETEALGPLLLRLRDETGCALLVIEHDMPLVTSISDRMLALDLGRVIAEGTPAEVVSHPVVVASYLGTDQVAIQRSGALA